MRSRWHKCRSNLLLGLTRSPHSNERFRSPKLQKTNPETRDTLIGMLSSCRVPFYICGSTRPLPPPRNPANSVDKRPESCTRDCTRFRRFGSRRTTDQPACSLPYHKSDYTWMPRKFVLPRRRRRRRLGGARWVPGRTSHQSDGIVAREGPGVKRFWGSVCARIWSQSGHNFIVSPPGGRVGKSFTLKF